MSTSAATLVTSSGATLNGSADPGGEDTTGWFRYSTSDPGTCNDTFGTRAPDTGGSPLGSGSGSVDYSSAITGLTPATTYYYCAIASNVSGTSFGTVQSFTTDGAPPSVTTGAATLVTGTTAQLNGSGNPQGDGTTAWFRYSTVSPGTCNDTFGTRAPASGGTGLGSGASSTPFSESITGLTPDTTYFVCAIASNSIGTSFGSVQSFTTDAAPDVTTSGATSVTTTGATLNGSADPNGDDATGWFRYSTSDPGTCNDTFGTRAPTSGGSDLGSGTSSTPFSRSVTDLSPGTTYYVCAIASNTVGTSFGDVQSFTTAGVAPTVTTNAATLVTGTTATLNGTANPGEVATTGWFRYSTVSPGTCNDTFGTRAPTSGGSSLGAGSSPVSYSSGITGLTPGTTYYVCAIASNSVGTSFGLVQSFTTDAAPDVTTSAATSVTATGATLNGFADPNGDSTTGWFRYSTTSPGTCDDSFGTRAPASGGSALGSGSAPVNYSSPITGLSPGTTYYFCAIASNSVDTSSGEVQSFTTDPAAPSVTTSPATSLTATGATLNGSANPNGASSTGSFRYDTTNPVTCNDTFGTRAPDSGGTSLGSGTSNSPFSQSITGLSPDTTYYFCAIASNTKGTSFGSVQTFKTQPTQPSVTTSAATSITKTGATLNGSANPNGASSTGWFRYSMTDPGTCNDSFGTRTPDTSASDSSLGSGTTPVSYSRGLAGLPAGTTYYFCAIAANSGGTSFGSVRSFTMPAAPVVTTSSATSVSPTGATLNGAANPGRATTLGWFRYGTANPGTCSHTFGTRAPASSGSNIGFGSSPVSFSRTITDLTAGKTYYFCAVAENVMGNVFGTVRSFTTPTAAPSVTTSSPTSVSTTTAQLNGAGNANGKSATGWFRYSTVNPGSCRDSFGRRVPGTAGATLGSGLFGYARAITGLAPGTTYYVCAIASNSVGISFGSVRSFTTAADTTPPGVTLGGELRQKVGRRVRVTVTLTEDAGVRSSGKVVIGSKTFALKRTKTRQVEQGVTTTFKLIVPARTLAAIKAALSNHKRVTGKITVVARDAAGNPTTKRRRVKIVR